MTAGKKTVAIIGAGIVGVSAAIELQRAIRESRKSGQHVIIDLPFEPSLEIREAPRFYSLPQPRLPLKPRPDVKEYRHPTLGALPTFWRRTPGPAGRSRYWPR